MNTANTVNIKDFKVGCNIKNTKTGKIGIVTRVYDEVNIVNYHLLRTPNNIHVICSTFDRFEIIG